MTPAPPSTSFRLPDRTKKQLHELAERSGMTLVQILIVAIDHMYREEIKK